MIKTKCFIGVIPLLLKVSLSLGQTTAPSDSLVYKKDSNYYKGVSDAKTFYSQYRKPAGATLVTTILSGPLGLIPAIGCSSNSPAIHNLGFPETDLMRNTNYNVGYTQTAFSIKKKKVWRNFTIGIFVFVVPATIVFNRLTRNGF